MTPTNNDTGNITPAKIPIFRLSFNTPDIKPTSVGPPEHPKSPPNAKRANIAVPPLGSVADALLNVPGHIIPTESPVIAQHTKLKAGIGINAIPT